MTMNELLVFKADTDTGLPRLLPTAMLADFERAQLEAELNERYDTLVHKENGDTIELQTRIGKLPYPPTFRLEIERKSRLPTIHLQPLLMARPSPWFVPLNDLETRPTRTAMWSEPTYNWPTKLCEALDRMLTDCAGRSIDSADRMALSFAIGELQQVIRSNPDLTVRVVLAGYFAFAEGSALAEGDENRASLYVLAGRALSGMFGNLSSPWRLLDRGGTSTAPVESLDDDTSSAFSAIYKMGSRVVNALLPDGLRDE
jgi:hypothetical protein